MPDSINRKLRREGLAPEEVGVHLKNVEHVRLIHCMYCCKGLIKKQSRILTVFEVGEPDKQVIMTVPTGVQCARCGTIWNFSTINE
jgi:hypothetical protein